MEKLFFNKSPKIPIDIRFPDRYLAAISPTQPGQCGNDVNEIIANGMVALAKKQMEFPGLGSVRGNNGMGNHVFLPDWTQGYQKFLRQAEYDSVWVMGQQKFYH